MMTASFFKAAKVWRLSFGFLGATFLCPFLFEGSKPSWPASASAGAIQTKGPTQWLFYRPHLKETGFMWDTWLFYQNGTYYLYYLARSGRRWNNISVALSQDAVHWREVGPVLRKRPDAVWMGSGSTWKSPRFEEDKTFYMNFSEWRGPRQTIFFAKSKDLLNWTRLGDEYEFVQDERYYKRTGRWDCIWTIPRPGGGLYGYWTATPKEGTGGRFGFGMTLDGVKWKALPPPRVEGAGPGEVGAIQKIGKKYYLMFGSRGAMQMLVSDRPEGPFRVARKNRWFLTGHTYFSRFFVTPSGEVLVNHHSIARNGLVYFPVLKKAALDSEGTFRLTWWKGNEALKHEKIPVALSADTTGPVIFLTPRFDVAEGVVLEGEVTLPRPGSARCGLYLECQGKKAASLFLDSKGRAELGPIKPDASGFRPEKRVDREYRFPKRTRFRLLLKHSLLEFYLSDILIECYSLPAEATGRIGLINGDEVNHFSNLVAWK